MGVDVHEERAQNDVMDHNPVCGHQSRPGPPAWVVRKITAAQAKRSGTKRRYYYEYPKSSREGP